MKFRKKEEIKKIIVQRNYLIRDVIKNLNDSQLKISIVVENDKLFGTIVDGDIRRGLLNGYNLDDSIEKIVKLKPIILTLKEKQNQVMMLMKENELQHIPVIDELKRPVGLYTIDDSVYNKYRENKVVIMAGGLGTRMLPITKKMPKAMINISGLPMIEHVVLWAKKCGFTNFVFSINYLGHIIKKHFLSGEKFNINIKYIEEKKPLGTVGSLCYLHHLKNETILVTNCDVVSSVDYSEVLDYHNLNSADATMVVRRYGTQNPFGVIETEGNNFLFYKEKPIKYENINAGIYVLESKILKYIEHEKYLDMPDLFMKLKQKRKKVMVYPIYESWFDLGQSNQNNK